jgi:predicted nucleotidyltransferase
MDHKLFGLRKSDIQNIISVLQSEKTVEEAIIFGSRAKGNYKEGSDVDIALKGKNLSLQLIGHISFLLNEELLCLTDLMC